MTDSTIDVLLPVYNGMPFVISAVNSVLEQTFPDFRLLILDDGSTDGTSEYLRRIDDPRVEVLRWSNCGLAASLNRGIDHSSAPFVARMDADDVSHPRRFESQLAALAVHPDVAALGCQVQYVGSCRTMVHGALPLSHDEILSSLLVGRHAMCHASLMIRREALVEVGGYWGAGVSEDTDLLLRISRNWRLSNLDDVLYSIRFHGSSINATRLREVEEYIGVAVAAYEHDLGKLDRNTAMAMRSLMRPTARSIARGWRSRLYRQGMIDLLGERPIRGRAVLTLCAASDPRRAWSRIRAASGRVVY